MLRFTGNKKFYNKCPSFSPDPHLKYECKRTLLEEHLSTPVVTLKRVSNVGNVSSVS